jgi:putative FmdB family regulatory protein
MPTYAYACTECDHRFDLVQSFHDDALTECPQCQGRLRKVFSSVGVVFKGSGFYKTDSRSSGSSSSSPAAASSSSGSSSEGAAASTSGNGSAGSASAPSSSAASSTGGSSAAVSSTASA